MNNNLLIFKIALLFLVNGCGTFQYPSIYNVDPHNLKDNESIFIVSAGASQTCKVEGSSILVKKDQEEISLMQLNNGFTKSMFDDEYGLVYTMVVPPGSYEFWYYANHPYVNDTYQLTNPSSIKAKEIKYIGEFYAFGACGHPKISIRDRRNRDINQVKIDFPSLDENSINIDLVELKNSSQGIPNMEELIKNKLNIE